MSGRSLFLSVITVVLVGTFAAAATADPLNGALPALSGGAGGGGMLRTAAPSDVLSVSTGTWDATDTLSYGYQWQRCSYVNAVIDASTSPIGFWRFDETSGPTATDSSIAGNDATYVGAPTFGVTGALGTDADTAVTFPADAGAQAGVAGGVPSGSAPLTIAAWVNSGSFSAGVAKPIAGGTSFIPNHTGTWLLDIYPSSSTSANLVLNVGTGTTERSVAVLHPNQWYFVAATDSGTTQKLYVNGALDSTFSGTSAKVASTLRIGYLPTATQSVRSFVGSIDDLALYDSALAPSEIGSLYAAATQPASGAGCEDIVGANDSSYAVSDADSGSSLRAAVTAYGADGSASANSDTSFVAGAAPAWPDGPLPQLDGPVIDSGTVTDANGAPIAGAIVSLYPSPSVLSVLRAAPLATTTTDSSGSYAISLREVPALSSGDGWLNAVRQVTAIGVVSRTGIDVQYDGVNAQWLDDLGNPVSPVATVLTPTGPAVAQPLRPIPYFGCPPITKLLWTTDKPGKVGEANSWVDDTVTFTYGAQKNADTTWGIAVSSSPNGGWSISGSKHISNSASWSNHWSGQWGHILFQKFEYEELSTQTCWVIKYQSDAVQYDGPLSNPLGDSTLANDGHCNLFPNHNRGGLDPNGKFTTNTEKAETFSAGVTVWNANLTARSGFSKNVVMTIRAGTNTSTSHLICGNNNSPSVATIVYAGP